MSEETIVRIAEQEIDKALAGELEQLLRSCFEGYPQRTYFKLPPHFRYIATINDKIVGQIAVELRVVRVGDEAVRTFGVVDVCVAESARSRGLAGRMLAELTAYARACELEFMLLFADDDRVYLADGWQHVTNKLSWVKIHEHQIVGQVHEADVPEAMVKVVGSRDWPAGPVDLLGHLF
jgi:GNAT superfamily N-acetyltransferase